MFLNIFSKKKDKEEYTINNLKSLDEKVKILYDDTYMYKCRKINSYVAILKSGKYFENAGRHGLYIYDLNRSKMHNVSSSFLNYDELTYHLSYEN